MVGVARWFPLLSALASGPAWAGPDVSVGLAAGVAVDMKDAASEGQTRLGAGAEVRVPVRVQLLDALALRADLRLASGSGVDQLTWTAAVDGVPIRFTDEDAHLAILGGLGAELGLEAQIPLKGRARPYLFGEVGVLGVGMFHAMRGGTAILLDPTQNDLGNPRNLDPYTLQAALDAGLGAGLLVRAGERVEIRVELGYSSAFVGPRALEKTAPEQEARREAFAYNPLRAVVGLSWRL